MAKRKVLITVKTYPNFSKKYDELVCTAGIDENGDWVRIYPVPFRKLPYHMQYSKYDWIEADVEKNPSDFRKESFKPINIDSEDCFKKIGSIDVKNNWAERKQNILEKTTIHTNMQELINLSREDMTSLAVFKPTEIVNFTYEEEEEKEWPKDKLESLNQMGLFDTANESNFKVVKKLPYKFKYHFKDCNGKLSKMMIEDWKVGALYWNVFRETGLEKQACEAVKYKFLTEFQSKDLYFFLGTTLRFHNVGHNPFMIIGVFYPKKETQYSMSF